MVVADDNSTPVRPRLFSPKRLDTVPRRDNNECGAGIAPVLRSARSSPRCGVAQRFSKWRDKYSRLRNWVG